MLSSDAAALELQRATDALYDAMGAYRFRPNMPWCECCIGAEAIEVLGAVQLRELTQEQLSRVGEHLLTTCGEVEDLKFLLPRLLELNGRGLMLGVVCRLLPKGRWTKWVADEQEAIMSVLQAWWRHTLLAPASQQVDVLEVFENLCETDADPECWLDDWRRLSPLSLANFISLNAENLGRARVWDLVQSHLSEVQAYRVRAALLSPATRDAIERLVPIVSKYDAEIVSSAVNALHRVKC